MEKNGWIFFYRHTETHRTVENKFIELNLFSVLLCVECLKYRVEKDIILFCYFYSYTNYNHPKLQSQNGFLCLFLHFDFYTSYCAHLNAYSIINKIIFD